jgi:hypothetical protein
MNFEQLQAAWDSQQDCPANTLDAHTLRQLVATNAKATRRAINIVDFAVVFVCTFFPYINGFFSGEHFYESIGAVINLGIVTHVLTRRLLRKRREQAFPTTLLGEVDRAIFRLHYLFWWSRNFAWWFMLPTGAYTILSLTQHFRWPGFLAALIMYPLITLLVVKIGNRQYAPAEAQLNSLRSKLDAES